MKSFLKIFAAVVVLTVGTFAFAWTPERVSSASAAENVALASAYGTYCSRCHGADGKANTAKGRELDADDLTTGKVQGMSTARLTSIIKHGKGDMPAFPKLSKAQIASIVRTVKSF